jgi:sugar lactone lactonase YvrE
MGFRRFPLPIIISGLVLVFLALTALTPATTNPGSVLVLSLAADHQERANTLAFSPDGKLLAVGTTAGIDFYDTQTWTNVRVAETDTWVRSLAFSPDGETLVAGLFDHTVQLWRVSDAQLLKTFTGHTNWVWSVAFSPDGQSVASASNDGTIRIWPVNGDAAPLVISQGAQSVRTVAFSPDGQLVAAGLSNGDIHLWRTSDGSLDQTLTGHTDWVRCLAFSPDGKLLATGGFDKTIRLWNVADGTLVRTLEGHVASVLAVVFSPEGTLLASGSEDTTIHLWRVSDGSQVQVFQGHTDFVFAVAFSPDGKLVASGSKDNSVRVWPVDPASFEVTTPTPQVMVTEENDATEQVTDCGNCHHPEGQMQAPRVFEVRCDTCHTDGISLNFCPAFPQASDATVPITYNFPTGLGGVPVNSENLSALIATPSNGETLYVKGGYTAPAFVTGQIVYNEGSPTDVDLSLEIWSGSNQTATLNAHPNSNGKFKFDLGLNPTGTVPYMVKPGGPDCIYCHEDYLSEAPLPEGQVHLVLVATAPDGEQARDERWLNVDVSGSASVPVHVVDDASGQPVPGLTVHADAVLYQWRDRYASLATDQDGNVKFTLEALSQYQTVYKIYVPSTVLNGDLYASMNPVEVTLPAGATSAPEVTLNVHRQTGEITGTLNGMKDSNLTKVPVWAIALPDGPAYQTSASADGTFAFQDIPVHQYLILPDTQTLQSDGYQSTQESLDLTRTPSASLTLDLSRQTGLTGQVTDQNGTALPFAWLTLAGADSAQPTNPVSGQYFLSDLPAGSNQLSAVAPGYYVETQRIDPSQDANPLDFQLIPRPETKQIDWGKGSLIIPSDTSAQVNGLTISMDQGWLWGQGGADQLLDIQLPDAEISVASGQFALERPVGQTPWFYLYAGTATVNFSGSTNPISLEAGQMVAVEVGANPLRMDATLAGALHPKLNEAPVSQSSQPPLTVRLQNWLLRGGIGVAQIITFVTYFLALIALIGLLFSVIFWLIRGKHSKISR